MQANGVGGDISKAAGLTSPPRCSRWSAPSPHDDPSTTPPTSPLSCAGLTSPPSCSRWSAARPRPPAHTMTLAPPTPCCTGLTSRPSCSHWSAAQPHPLLTLMTLAQPLPPPPTPFHTGLTSRLSCSRWSAARATSRSSWTSGSRHATSRAPRTPPSPSPPPPPPPPTPPAPASPGSTEGAAAPPSGRKVWGQVWGAPRPWSRPCWAAASLAPALPRAAWPRGLRLA